jgi:hypothetical protein
MMLSSARAVPVIIDQPLDGAAHPEYAVAGRSGQE